MIGTQSYSWIAWNILLAAIPALLAYPIAAGIDQLSIKRKKLPLYAWVLPLVVWLAFLPNTSYLLTEWRHFLFDSYYTNVRAAVPNDPTKLVNVAREGLFFALYSAVGAFLFGLAIRPIHRVAQKAGQNVFVLSIPFYLLVSFGVYLGLMVRLNSWDLVLHPRFIIHLLHRAVVTPYLMGTIVGFSVVLWFLYMVVDIWVDGLQLRLRGPKAAAAR
jgi:uncharacterized membrane protein